MEKKCKPYPTRANMFISMEGGLLYERLCRVWDNMLPNLKMTELQELEFFRKADVVGRMTSRSQGKVVPPVESAHSEAHI